VKHQVQFYSATHGAESPAKGPLRHLQSTEFIVHLCVECTYLLTDEINNSFKIMFCNRQAIKVKFYTSLASYCKQIQKLKICQVLYFEMSFEIIVQDLQHPT